MLVEGSPGIGKTTFCLKIAYDWANGKIPKGCSFPKFKIVLLLKCRDIDGDIIKAIDEQLLPEDDDVKKELRDYIRDIYNQEQVLIILDGLDELPVGAEHHVDRLLRRRMFPFCFLLATSRQERGIELRQNVNFDVLLQIEGFTDKDAFEYIRKHFRLLGPEHLSKGERLIKAIQENSFLHALPNNPLNLLLLCVVFEDYEGELPSRRTELYQIIVRCILRRFCAKNKLEAPRDDEALEKEFEQSLLALGELAWKCLLEDRLSFRERELAKFEEMYKDLAARISGLVFKEASLRKINPQHEYHFFHKTFAEHLAAAYLAFLLLKKEVNIFKEFRLDFHNHIVVKYRQVFLFLSGILGEKASILFSQIGEKLDSKDWSWLRCNEEEATFFTESFSESGNAEQVAMALCTFIPFPLTVEIDIYFGQEYKGLFIVAKYCKTFSNLQHPEQLTVNLRGERELNRSRELLRERIGALLENVVDYLASCSHRLASLCILTCSLATVEAQHLFDCLSANSTLSSFTLKTLYSISSRAAVIVGRGLVASKALKTVTFELKEEWGEAWASALEMGLSPNTPLQSVVLKIYGSMSDTAVLAFKRILVHKCVTSVDVTLYGGILDSLATTIGEGLAVQTVLKSFTLTVYGRLSQSALNSLERGLLQNCSLDTLEVKVFGDLPESWATVVRGIISENKPKRKHIFHPGIKGKIATAKLANLCGELSYDGSEALGKVLVDSTPFRRTVNIHGKVGYRVANSLSSYLKSHKADSFVTLNILGELTRGGKIAFEELKTNGQNHYVKVHCAMSNNSLKGLDFCIDDPSLLPSVFTKIKDSRKSKLALTVNGMSETFAHGLDDVLTNSTSLTVLALTVNNFSGKSGSRVDGLGNGLANNTFLTTLTLTASNYSGKDEDWMTHLGQGLAQNMSVTTLALAICFSGKSKTSLPVLRDILAKNNSLTTLSLLIDNRSSKRGEWIQSLTDGLAKNTLLSALSVTIHEGGKWIGSLGDALAKNRSLTSLTLTVNNCDKGGLWANGLCDGLESNVSLTTFRLTVNNCHSCIDDLVRLTFSAVQKSTTLTVFSFILNPYHFIPRYIFGDSVTRNTSLTTLSLTVGNCSDTTGSWMLGLGDTLANCMALSTLTLTVTNNGGTSFHWMLFLRNILEKITPLSTLSLTFNNFDDMSEHYKGDELGNFARKLSLTTMTLIINSYSVQKGGCMEHLNNVLAKLTSLTTFTLKINNYRAVIGNWMDHVGGGLEKSPSLVTFSLTVNNYGEMSEDWMPSLGDSVAKSKSLTTLSITINSCSEVSVGQLLALCNTLARSETLTTLSLTINDHSSTSRGLGCDLSKCFADCKSLTSLSLAVSLYGEEDAEVSTTGTP